MSDDKVEQGELVMYTICNIGGESCLGQVEGILHHERDEIIIDAHGWRGGPMGIHVCPNCIRDMYQSIKEDDGNTSVVVPQERIPVRVWKIEWVPLERIREEYRKQQKQAGDK